MLRYLLIFFAVGAMAQQQIVPKEFNREQRDLFEELTQAVSAPCCNNGIPVAYHMSPMANIIRDQITEAILQGKSKKEIMDTLAEETYGSRNQKIIFTVPDKSGVGIFAYIVPFFAALLGIGFVFLYRHRRPEQKTLSEEELLAHYKDAILNRLGQT